MRRVQGESREPQHRQPLSESFYVDRWEAEIRLEWVKDTATLSSFFRQKFNENKWSQGKLVVTAQHKEGRLGECLPRPYLPQAHCEDDDWVFRVSRPWPSLFPLNLHQDLCNCLKSGTGFPSSSAHCAPGAPRPLWPPQPFGVYRNLLFLPLITFN